MSGHRKWSEIQGPVSPDRRARIDQITRAMDEAQRLYDLRRARGLSQVQLAQVLEVDQPRVSRIERGEDLYLSTLRRYVEALGGQLELRAVFDGEEAVQLAV